MSEYMAIALILSTLTYIMSLFYKVPITGGQHYS